MGEGRQYLPASLRFAPFITRLACYARLLPGSFAKFFTETIPGIFTGAWKAVVGLFRRVFISPFVTAWHATRDFFRGSFVRFFTETIPGIFTGAWDKAVGIFRRFFRRAVLRDLVCNPRLLPG